MKSVADQSSEVEQTNDTRIWIPEIGSLSTSHKIEFGHDRRLGDTKKSYVGICGTAVETSNELENFLSFSQSSSLFLSFITRYFNQLNREFVFCFSSPKESVSTSEPPKKKGNILDYLHCSLGILKTTNNTTFEEIHKQFCGVLEGKNKGDPSIHKILRKSDFSLTDIALGILTFEQFDQIQKRKDETTAFDIVCLLDLEKRKKFQIMVNENAFFDTNFVKNMENNFPVFLKSVHEKPNELLGKLETITEVEKVYQINMLNEMKENPEAIVNDKTLKDFFEEAAEKYSGQVAVEFQGKKLTFQELNETANQLAHYVKQKYNVKPKDVFGVSVEKSIELVVCILAAWKLGCVYFPVEAKFPEDRFRFLFHDTSCKFIVTNAKHATKFDFLNKEKEGSVSVMSVEEFFAKGSGQSCPKENLPCPFANEENIASNYAYISYTSGSTGKPKAVIHEHRGALSIYNQLFTRLNLKAEYRMLFFASISFDEHLNTLTTLIHGSTIIIVPEEIRYSPEDLWTFISENKVDAMKLTPSVLKTLKREKIPTLKSVSIIGEVCDLDTMKFWASSVPDFAVCYGSQESILDHGIRWNPKTDLQKNVGSLFENFKCYILDRYLQPLPIGIPGELHVSGPTIGGGYLNRPEITKEKFIKNPFVEKEDCVMYKTGDFAYILSNGELVFSKRIDKMVKIRGMRVELGEIELTMIESGLVSNCVVGVKPGKDGNQVLFTMVIPQENMKEDHKNVEAKLKEFLAQRLPYYMVPHVFIFRASFPFTFSGKLNKRELFNFNIQDYFKAKFVAPTTENEKKMAGVFSTILEVDMEGIGVLDDFYLLGGNSLGLILLKNKIKEVFQVDIDFPYFLELHDVTVQKLCELVTELSSGEKREKLGPEMTSFCRDFVRDGKTVSNNVLYRLCDMSDLEGVCHLDAEIFCDKEHGPLYITHPGITYDQFRAAIDPFIKLGIQEKLTFVAVDQETGKIVHLVIAFAHESEKNVEVPDQAYQDFKLVFDMLDEVDALVDHKDLHKPVLHAFISAGLPGVPADVFWKMELLTEVLGQSRGFKSVFDEPVSHITQINGKILGQKKHPGVKLEEFEFPKGSGKFPYKGVEEAHMKKFGNKEEKSIIVSEMYCLTRDLREHILPDSVLEEESPDT